MITRDRNGLYTVPDLPYGFSALEPHIDARTMEIHHDKHHAGYTSKLNAAFEGRTDLFDIDLTHVLNDLNKVPADIRTAVRNNGGGYYNHALFWRILGPQGSGGPQGELQQAISKRFDDFDSFRSAFTKAAETRFGSGWAWLVVDRQGTLQVTSTANQDNPLMTGIADVVGTPILGLDVWEHAYYLLYQNRRPDYIQAFWNVINWREVEGLYQQALR